MSARFHHHFAQLKESLPIIKDVRSRGMMIGIELNIPATPAVGQCMERGVLINATHDTVVRLLPALNISKNQVDEGCQEEASDDHKKDAGDTPIGLVAEELRHAEGEWPHETKRKK
jgi:acetylornithine/succinyldiaminopimelate/putrescine aminotransferase